MIPKKERRRDVRYPIEERIEVLWQEERGDPYILRCRCLDVSAGGLRIEVPNRIPARTKVNFIFDQAAFAGSGSVRYCIGKGLNYILGIEFCGGLRFPVPPTTLFRKKSD